jgi:hypothetical protein
MEFSDKTDLLKLNAALTILMDEWDEDAARIVIGAFHSMPASNRMTRIKHTFKNNSSITGYTQEAGNVTFPDKEIKTTVTGEREQDTARVGHYKVKRYCFNARPDIRWQHFWKSDPATMLPGEVPNPTFALHYDETTLQPVALWRFDFCEDTTRYPWSFLLRDAAIYMRNLFSRRLGYIIKTEYHFYIGRPTLLFPKHKM